MHRLALPHPITLAGWLAAVLSATLASGTATTTVINDHFDDATVTGWASRDNIRTFSAHNITESGTDLSSEVVATQSNTHRGIVSTTSFDPDSESAGFSMTFNVSSVAATTHTVAYDQIAITTIPEPSSALLLAMTVIAAASLRRRRR